VANRQDQADRHGRRPRRAPDTCSPSRCETGPTRWLRVARAATDPGLGRSARSSVRCCCITRLCEVEVVRSLGRWGLMSWTCPRNDGQSPCRRVRAIRRKRQKFGESTSGDVNGATREKAAAAPTASASRSAVEVCDPGSDWNEPEAGWPVSPDLIRRRTTRSSRADGASRVRVLRSTASPLTQ
jgi:hypothetical protein